MTYVEVYGLPTWHEVRGDGPPVVLLHGAFAGASCWSAQMLPLARAAYKVPPQSAEVMPHPDVEGPLTYQVMADDTIAYLQALIGGPAHLVGWSEGAVVGGSARPGAPPGMPAGRDVQLSSPARPA